jgi:hypothetical protein
LLAVAGLGSEPVILALSSEENLKFILLPVARGISSPVCKLRPTLGLQVFGENVPKPLSSKDLPSFIESFTALKNCSMAILTSSLVIPHNIAVSLIKSFFVIGMVENIVKKFQINLPNLDPQALGLD